MQKPMTFLKSAFRSQRRMHLKAINEAFVNAANEQELEAAWNNLSAEEQRVFEQLMEEVNDPKMHWHFSHSCMMMPLERADQRDCEHLRKMKSISSGSP